MRRPWSSTSAPTSACATRGDYPRWYGWTHPAPHLLGGAVYGLAELHRAEIAVASLIATGGCLATASILGLAPLACAGVLDPAIPVVIEAKVGSSAGGCAIGRRDSSRASKRRDPLVRADRSPPHRGNRPGAPPRRREPRGGVLRDRRRGRPRRARHRARVSQRPTSTTATSGSCTARGTPPSPSCASSSHAPGLHRSPSPKLLTGTNYCDVGFERDPHSRRVVVTAALDNLVKGSAGQAVQAFNIRHGFPETLGLEFGGLYPI